MADPAGTYSDGALKFGSQILTIKDSSGSDVAYIAEDFSLEQGAKFLVTNNEVGVPNKQTGIKEIPTGSATLQFPALDTKEPKLFAEFTAVCASGNKTLIVAKVGEKYSADGEAKINIDVRLKLNA